MKTIEGNKIKSILIDESQVILNLKNGNIIYLTSKDSNGFNSGILPRVIPNIPAEEFENEKLLKSFTSDPVAWALVQ